jgi:hypothetical protein
MKYRYNSICRIVSKQIDKRVSNKVLSIALGTITVPAGALIAYGFNYLASFNKINDPTNVIYFPGFTTDGVINAHNGLAIATAVAAGGAAIASEYMAKTTFNLMSMPSKSAIHIVPAVQTAFYAATVAGGILLAQNYEVKRDSPKEHKLALQILAK